MMVPSVKVVGINVDKQSKHLTQKITPKDRLSNKSPNLIDALNRIFGRDISISNCCDECDSIIHDVCIHSVPGKEGHLVESPTVVDPDDHWGVGAI